VTFLFDDRALHEHIRKLEGAIKAPSARQKRRKGNTMTTPENTETGVIAFYDSTKGFGICTPDGADPTDKSQSLYVSGAALQRAGIANIEKGARIRFRREQPRHPGRKCECQDVVLERAA
jgi:cold shock CspA family protein